MNFFMKNMKNRYSDPTFPNVDPRIRIHYYGKVDPRIRIRIHVKMRWIRNAAYNRYAGYPSVCVHTYSFKPGRRPCLQIPAEINATFLLLPTVSSASPIPPSSTDSLPTFPPLSLRRAHQLFLLVEWLCRGWVWETASLGMRSAPINSKRFFANIKAIVLCCGQETSTYI